MRVTPEGSGGTQAYKTSKPKWRNDWSPTPSLLPANSLQGSQLPFIIDEPHQVTELISILASIAGIVLITLVLYYGKQGGRFLLLTPFLLWQLHSILFNSTVLIDKGIDFALWSSSLRLHGTLTAVTYIIYYQTVCGKRV
jgi:hypothetical protein